MPQRVFGLPLAVGRCDDWQRLRRAWLVAGDGWGSSFDRLPVADRQRNGNPCRFRPVFDCWHSPSLEAWFTPIPPWASAEEPRDQQRVRLNNGRFCKVRREGLGEARDESWPLKGKARRAGRSAHQR